MTETKWPESVYQAMAMWHKKKASLGINLRKCEWSYDIWAEFITIMDHYAFMPGAVRALDSRLLDAKRRGLTIEEYHEERAGRKPIDALMRRYDL